MPNPVRYYNLASEIAASWAAISLHLSKERFSVTTPVPTPTGRRAVRTLRTHADRARLRANYRTNAKYVLHADIQRFYPSIYTHSLAWAIHGKTHAKQHKGDMKLLGNRLDYLSQQLQDQQTTGIPIGPDTSLVLAEILLTAADIDLRTEVGSLRGFRALDDYELTFRTRAEAEEALAVLESVLARYELTLNDSKTHIRELPLAIEEHWPDPLRDFALRESGRAQETDLMRFFSLAFQLSRQHVSVSVLRYAISRSSGFVISSTAWTVYQDLLLQCASSEPGTLRYVLAEMRKYKNAGRTINTDRVADMVSTVVERYAPLSHGTEVAWALWCSIALAVPLGPEATTLISEMDDPLVALLALDARERGLVASGLDTAKWEDLMRPEQLYGANWMLVYEANIKGWLPSKSRRDHVDADPAFGFLKTRGVSFYNKRASSLGIRRWPLRRSGPIPGDYDF